MKTHRIALLVAGVALSCTPAFTQVPSDTEIRKILADRVGAENNGIGIVVGIVDANGRRIVSYGSLAKNDNRKLDGDTVFEIGSMTKVFTSLVLMDMVKHGEVALTDPISKYLPESVKVPERNLRKITLADLSTQSSGLPGMPTNFTPKDANNPYADYTVQQMYDFLSGYKLTRDIGSQYEYSNLGVGLLGHVLSLRAGMSYEALVRSRVCDPLGLKDTRITLTPEHAGTPRRRTQRRLGSGGELGPPDARGSRRAALNGKRYLDVPRGQSRFHQNAAGAGDGGRSFGAAVRRRIRHGNRLRMAYSDQGRQLYHLA
jgi:CubicO group peptidase (beta-lactamase class C family)